VLIAEQEILIVVASLVIHCCAINKVIVASLLYDVADVLFTVEETRVVSLAGLFVSGRVRA